MGFKKHTHDIGLGTNGNQAVDMLADGHQDLSGHVPALLRSWGLVLDVNTGSTLLNEQFGQLHDCGQASVSSIGIGNDGPKVIDVSELAAVRFRQGGNTLFPLLAVVEELGHEEVGDLVGDGSLVEISTWREIASRCQTHVWIVREIWAGLIRGGGRRGGLPAGNVDGIEEFRHLRQHSWLQAAVRVACIFVLGRGS